MANFHRFQLETLEWRQLLASDWRNGSLVGDVDNSALVTPLDVLQVINDLNNLGSRQLPAHKPSSELFVDVSGDGWLSALDVLLTQSTHLGICRRLLLEDWHPTPIPIITALC